MSVADPADAHTLSGDFSRVLHHLRPHGLGHDAGRVAVDLAVMLADGDEAIRDLAVLHEERDVFGTVASTPTVSRVPTGIDTAALSTAGSQGRDRTTDRHGEGQVAHSMA